jgi:hypothetical protein
MKLTDAILALVCIASVALIAANLLARSPDPAPAPPPPAPEEPVGTEETARLRDEIRAVRGRIAELTSEKAALARPVAAEPANPEPGEPEEPPAVPARLLEEAARLGVPEALAATAWEHWWRTKEKKGSPAAAAERLKAAGEDGFRAVVALIRAGYRATWNRPLLEATYSPGLEQLLIDLVEDPSAGRSRWSGLRYLSIADTPRVREFLVAQAGRQSEPAALWNVAEALGDLHEPRGAAPLEGRFYEPEFVGVRPLILQAIGQMGGDDAKRILIAHLRHPHGDALHYAIAALGRIDPDAAREEARRLLDGPRAPHLDSYTREGLQSAAREK